MSEMRKLFAMVMISLGLVVGFGMMNNASACDDCVNEPVVYMTYEQLMQFEQAIYDMYCDKYCINYCDKCEIRYYEECMCESIANGCGSDCEVCIFYDYEIFINDYYDMIMDIYEERLEELEESRIAREKESNVIVIYEF